MTSLSAKRNVPSSQVLPYLSLLHPALCEVLLFQLVPLQVGWKCILESESVKKLKFYLASMRWFLCCNLMSYFLLQRWQSNLCSPCSSITLCLRIIIKMQMIRTIPKGRLAKILATISDMKPQDERRLCGFSGDPYDEKPPCSQVPDTWNSNLLFKRTKQFSGIIPVSSVL